MQYVIGFIIGYICCVTVSKLVKYNTKKVLSGSGQFYSNALKKLITEMDQDNLKKFEAAVSDELNRRKI